MLVSLIVVNEAKMILKYLSLAKIISKPLQHHHTMYELS
jgi:hypothetical protein